MPLDEFFEELQLIPLFRLLPVSYDVAAEAAAHRSQRTRLDTGSGRKRRVSGYLESGLTA
jgi:hypothetical protein